MKYKVKGNLFNGVFNNVLANRGIDDINKIIQPSAPQFKLGAIRNIDKAIEVFIKNINTSKILVPIDTDVDGFTSASLIYQVVKILKPQADINLYFHENKEHGFSNSLVDYVLENEYNFIIMADAGSNDIEAIELLKSKNIDILILDHHIVERYTEKAIIVNNQLEESNINKNFSGVGIVYLFFQYLVNIYDIKLDMRFFADIIATGLVADSVNVVDEDIRFICNYGMKNIRNSLLKEYFKTEECNYKKIGWGIAPLINAIIREGSQEEKKEVFLALSTNNINRIFTVTKKKKNKETNKYDNVIIQQNYYEYILDLCLKIKSRQDKKVKKIVDDFLDTYNKKDNIGIFIISEDNKKLSGLIANKLADRIQRPVLVLIERGAIYTGSGRGYDKFCSNFRELLLSSNLVNFASGHNQAFGMSINKEKVYLLKEYFNKLQAEEAYYEVDYKYIKTPPYSDIELIANFENQWSKGFEEPIFLVSEINIDKDFIYYKNGVMRFKTDNVVFIKKGVTKEEYNNIKNTTFSSLISLDIICKFVSNIYLDKKNYQIEIVDYEVKKNDYLYGFF